MLYDPFKAETPTTEEVLDAYLAFNDRGYRNPDAQTRRVIANREEFETWLAQIRAEAWDEGVEVGRYYAEDITYAPTNPYRS